MKFSRRNLPSSGFVFLVSCWIAVLLFFLWGLAEPDMDRVWHMMHRFEAGDLSSMTDEEEEALEECLDAIPNFADAFLRGEQLAGIVESTRFGWGQAKELHLLVSERAAQDTRAFFECRVPEDSLPLELSIEGTVEPVSLVFHENAIQWVDLKLAESGKPALLEVKSSRDLSGLYLWQDGGMGLRAGSVVEEEED